MAPLVSLAVLLVFFAFAADNFFKPASLVVILKQGSVLAIVSAGLTFVLLCAEIDLAVGMIALWAAALCGWLFEAWIFYRPMPPFGALGTLAAVIAIPLATSLVLGLVSGLLTVWSRLPSFIITLAMMFIAEGAAMWLTKSRAFRIPEILKTLGNDGLRWEDRTVVPYSAILAALVLLAGHVVLQHTRFGRYVYMTGGNREAARLAGVRTGRIVVACLVISAFCAGLGGLINAGRISSLTLDQNKDLLLSAVACVVLGGTSLFGGEGSMGKTLIGVLTFTVLNLGLAQIPWIAELARQLLTGIVLMATLVINGVLAKKGR